MIVQCIYANGILDNITEMEILKEKNKLYEYLSSYGFGGQINQYFHTPTKEEKCGIIVYNLEKSKKGLYYCLQIWNINPH